MKKTYLRISLNVNIKIKKWKAQMNIRNILCLLLLVPSFSAMSDDEKKISSIVKKTAPSVVEILDDKGSIRGSGFYLKSNVVVTNFHVIETLTGPTIRNIHGDIGKILAVVNFNYDDDYALLRVSLKGEPIAVAGVVAVGEPVLAIGNPKGLSSSVSSGIVSSLRTINGQKIIQTDAAINPGNSGGPLINQKSQAIGIVTSKLENSQGIGFAIPIQKVKLSGVNGELPMSEFQNRIWGDNQYIRHVLSNIPSRWRERESNGVWLIDAGEKLTIEREFPEEDKKLGFRVYGTLDRDGRTFRGNLHNRFSCLLPSTQVKTCTIDNKVSILIENQNSLEINIDLSKFECSTCNITGSQTIKDYLIPAQIFEHSQPTGLMKTIDVARENKYKQDEEERNANFRRQQNEDQERRDRMEQERRQREILFQYKQQACQNAMKKAQYYCNGNSNLGPTGAASFCGQAQGEIQVFCN